MKNKKVVYLLLFILIVATIIPVICFADTGKTYVVEHYLSDDNGNYESDPSYTEVKKEKVGINVFADPINIEGYVIDETANNVISGYVQEDEVIHLKLYYKHDLYVCYLPGAHGTFVPEEYHNLTLNQVTPTFQGQITGEDGYTFIGWNREIQANVTNSVSYIALWKKDGEALYSQKYYFETDNGFVLDDNYTEYFVGNIGDTISVEPSINYPYYFDETTSDASCVILENNSACMNIYCRKYRTIKYEPGQYGNFESQIFSGLKEGDKTPEFVGHKFGNNGYAFLGWNITPSEYVLTDAVYTAMWQPQAQASYTLVYNPGDKGTFEPIRIDNLPYNIDTPNPQSFLACEEGYEFDDWTPTLDTKVTSDKIYTATWKKKLCTINFDANGGEPILDTIDLYYGDIVGALPTPIRNGFTFDGWVTENNVEINPETIYNLGNTVTLYARWTPNTYKVTYKDLNGCDEQNTNPTQYTVFDNNFTLVDLSRTGFYFLGWYDEKQGGNQITTIDTSIARDIELYARWQINPNERKSLIYYVRTSQDSANIRVFDNFIDAKNFAESDEEVMYLIFDENNDMVYPFTPQDIESHGNSYLEYYVKENSTDPNNSQNTFYTIRDAINYADTTGYSVYDSNGNVVYVPFTLTDLYLNSDIYMIGNDHSYQLLDLYLTRVEPNTTLAQFEQNISTNGTAMVFNKNGTKLISSDLVGTGMILRVTKNNEIITCFIVVNGDVDGDGIVTVTDLSSANRYFVDETNVNMLKKLALDVDYNKIFDVTDISKIQKLMVEG